MGSKAVNSYLILWILWEVKLISSSVPDPCPEDIQSSAQVTDMCISGSAIEDIDVNKDGNENYDSVTLRAKIQKDNCICLVFVENQSLESNQMYIEPYLKLQGSAPSAQECGLDLLFDFYHMERGQQVIPDIKCNSGKTGSAISLLKSSVMRFTSKKVSGNFTTGYCISIHRVHTNGQNGTLKMVCDVPGVTPTLQIATTQLPDLFTSELTSSSSSVKHYPMSSDKSTIYIAAGVSAGVLFILIVVLVIIYCKRKSPDKTIKTQEASEPDTTPTHEQDDPDYNGLKHNMLYVSADHQDVLEGDYHTVDNDQPPIYKKVSEHDINYSTVDDNVSLTSLNTMPFPGVIKKAHKGPGYENFECKENTKRAHKISQEGNGDTYAVVDKKRITGHVNNKKASLSPTYAVVDKTEKQKMENI
ncbi:unnamed protein product [Mytilus coruscus]|uniref:CUB domain-containing protein n=1 Tax=Mytilus coruscus TaxID=42192 RepID=A0A6J8EEG9_MYTCO|nr:unnamed protein product [Mytilus coruscus]